MDPVDTQTLGWQDVPHALREAFLPWQGEPSEEWARDAWNHIVKAGLAGYAGEVERVGACIRLMALCDLYIDFARVAWEGTKQPDWPGWMYELSISDFRLGQWAGKAGHDLSEDLEEYGGELAPNALECLTIDARETVVEPIEEGFGGKPGLFLSLYSLFCAVADLTLEEEADADFLRNQWPLAVERAEVDRPPDQGSRLILWVNDGCPKVDENGLW